MDELGFNKIAGAILATALGVMVLREVPHFFMHTDAPETPVYSVGAIDMGAGEEEAIDLPFPQQSWVDAMDADEGAKVFKKCQSCHNAEQGGANGTGPNLYGVVGSQTGHHPGFNYSTAMTSTGFDWTYEHMDAFLTKPAAHVKGTKMAFIGLKKEEDRAAVIEYLRIHADNPVPKPEAKAAPAPEEPTEMAEGESAEDANTEGATEGEGTASEESGADTNAQETTDNSEADSPVTDEEGQEVEASTEEPAADPSDPEETAGETSDEAADETPQE